MLAQNFKTPAELEISDAEFDALAKVLGMLEREEFSFGKVGKTGEMAAPTSGMTFHMNCLWLTEECGTVACIGGWAAYFMGENPNDYLSGPRPRNLFRLFWPGGVGYFATRSQAAIALRNYLTPGVPRSRPQERARR